MKTRPTCNRRYDYRGDDGDSCTACQDLAGDETTVGSLLSEHDGAERYRLAQGSRLLRYYRDLGLSDTQIAAGGLGVDLSPIRGPDGMILPQPEDFHHDPCRP
jgi:hypothetical protein